MWEGDCVGKSFVWEKGLCGREVCVGRVLCEGVCVKVFVWEGGLCGKVKEELGVVEGMENCV